MARVDLERGLERRDRHRAIATGVGLAAAGEQIGVLGQDLEALLVGAGGELVVVLFEGKFAARKVDVAVFRVGLLHGGEDFLEHVLRVVAAHEQRGAAEDEEIRRRAILPLAVAHGGDDVLHEARRLLGPAGGERHLAREPAQADAARVAEQRLLHRGVGLGIAAGREQGAHEEHRPLGVAGALGHVGQLALGELDHRGVVAGEQTPLRLRRIGGADCRRPPRQHRQQREATRGGAAGENHAGEQGRRGRRSGRGRVMRAQHFFSSLTAKELLPDDLRGRAIRKRTFLGPRISRMARIKTGTPRLRGLHPRHPRNPWSK
jgi:hypothetical protein